MVNQQLQRIFANYETSVDPALFKMSDVQSLRMILDESRILNIGNADLIIEELLKFAISVHNEQVGNQNNKIELENVLSNFDTNFEHAKSIGPTSLVRGNSYCARSDLYNNPPALSYWTPSVADPYEEEDGLMNPFKLGMEIERDSLATVEQSGISRDEPEMIFPEHAFRHNNHGPKVERVSS